MRGIKHALVLGGAGFLGNHVIAELIACGIETVLIDANSPAPGSPAATAGVISATVSADSLGAVLSAQQFDAIFHLAGASFVPPSVNDPMADLESNAGTTLNVLEAVRQAGQDPVIAYVSSAAVYGNGVYMPMDENHPLEPVSPYGVAKLASELYLAQYHRLHDTRGFSVRPFSLYGPWQRKQVVYDLICRSIGGERPLTIAAPRDVTRDYVFGPDAGRALVRLASAAPAIGESYNLATGIGTSLGELTRVIIDAVGPSSEAVFTGTLRLGDPLRWTGDPSEAAKLDVTCETTLESGVAATVQWVRDLRGR